MTAQVMYIGITLLCISAGSLYSEDSEFIHKSHGNNSVTDPNSHFLNLTIHKNFTMIDTGIKNMILPGTISTLSVSENGKSKTSPTVMSMELSSTEKRTETTSKTERTRTIIEETTTITSETEEAPDDCIPDSCTSDHCVFTKSSGCIRLREDAADKSYSYTITVPDNSSLIYVTMEPENDLFPDSSITFHFSECHNIVQATWKIEEGERIKKKIYTSKSNSLVLDIETDKTWINQTLRYRELLPLEPKDYEITADEGVLDPPMLDGIRYRPNTRVTYLLEASKTRWNESSVLITLSSVNLDEGDYLLIGAGKVPFAGPQPFYFTGLINKSRNYYIASDSVYVRFVSGASQNVDKKGFHIKWKRSGTAIIKPDEKPEEETDYIIQSVGICFYNKSLIAEFNRSEEDYDLLQKFREKFASIANGYAKQNSIPMDFELTASSVKIFRVSSIIDPIGDEMPEGGIYAMVSIVRDFDRKKAVFRRRQLEEIVRLLDKTDKDAKHTMLGFKVGQCPHVDSYMDWYIAAVSLIVISTIALIAVWICTSVSKWKGIAKWKKESVHCENIYCKEPEVPARENDYIKYTPGINKPRMRLTTSDGDSMTLDSDSLNHSRLEQDDGPDRVLFHSDWIMKMKPASKEILTCTTENVEIEPRRSILQTFAAPIPTTRKKGSGRMWIDTSIQMGLLPHDNAQPVDHEYDALIFPSISSSSTTCLVNDEGETRL